MQFWDWPPTTKVGCSHQLCERFFTSTMRLYNIEFYVCKFSTPQYFQGSICPCSEDSCPDTAPICVEFTSQILGEFNSPGFKYCGTVV